MLKININLYVGLNSLLITIVRVLYLFISTISCFKNVYDQIVLGFYFILIVIISTKISLNTLNFALNYRFIYEKRLKIRS